MINPPLGHIGFVLLVTTQLPICNMHISLRMLQASKDNVIRESFQVLVSTCVTVVSCDWFLTSMSPRRLFGHRCSALRMPAV